MKKARVNVGMCVSIILSTLTHALRIPFNTFINLEPPAHVLRYALLSCDQDCRCTDACMHMNYNNGRLQCDLAEQHQSGRSLHFEGRVGHLKEVGDFSPTNGSCSSLHLHVCPDLVNDGVNLVLDNFMPTRRQRLMQFTWSAGKYDWIACEADSKCAEYDIVTLKTQSAMRVTCQLDSDCVDAESGCRDGQCWCRSGLYHDPASLSCVARSSMRKPCQLHNDCVDAESECRDGQCWCKPGLSLDIDSLSCVALCPGQYGSTFQVVKNFKNEWDGPTHFLFNTNLEMCMVSCLIHTANTGHLCKFADSVSYGSQHQCVFAAVAANEVPKVGYVGATHTHIQRDCRSKID